MKRVITFFVFLALFSSCLCAVEVLTEENYEKIINEKKFVMVKYYAPWCGHCKNLAPVYEEAALEMADSEVIFAEVDCTENAKICSDIRGYPTLKFWREGKEIPYEGARTLAALTTFANKHILPPLSVFEDENEFKKFIKGKSPVFIGEFSEKNQDFEEFSKAANELSEEATMAALISDKIKESKVILKRKEENEIYNEVEITYDGLLSWWEIHRIPLLETISPENAMNYMEAKKPVGYFYADPENPTTNDLKKEIMQVAEELRANMLFTHVDSTKYGQMAKSMGLIGKSFPSFTIKDPEDANYAYPESETITKEKIKEHCEKMIKGEIEQTIKSEPIPEDPIVENVYQIVGSNFKSVVLDKEKDVFVKFYAPWCGHCKKMKPAYSQLGEEFKDDDTMIIGEMDLTANDPPAGTPRVTGFPTVILFPAGNKDKPVTYKGSRTLDDMKKFLNENRDLKELKEEEIESQKEDKDEL